ARPVTPPSSVTSTSTVGLPRESRISRPCTLVIFNMPPALLSSTPATPVGLGLEAERLLGERPDERLVLGRHDDDAGVGEGVTPAIFVGVVADERAARNQDVAVDDRAANSRVPADAHARHQNALLDVTEAVDPHVRTQHAAVDAAARDNAAGRDHRIE